MSISHLYPLARSSKPNGRVKFSVNLIPTKLENWTGWRIKMFSCGEVQQGNFGAQKSSRGGQLSLEAVPGKSAARASTLLGAEIKLSQS